MERIFFAFSLPASVRTEGKQVQKEWKEALKEENIRWIPEENWHITLHFLGEIPKKTTKVVEKSASNIIFAGKGQLTLEAAGVFPGTEEARVLHILLKASDEVLSWHKQLEELLLDQGITTEARPWTPHITLGRVKGEGIALKEFPDVSPISFTPDRIELMKSTRLPQGSVYQTAASFPIR